MPRATVSGGEQVPIKVPARFASGAARYLGGDVYVEDMETVTRIFVNAGDRRTGIIELLPEQAQILFEELAKRRG